MRSICSLRFETLNIPIGDSSFTLFLISAGGSLGLPHSHRHSVAGIALPPVYANSFFVDQAVLYSWLKKKSLVLCVSCVVFLLCCVSLVLLASCVVSVRNSERLFEGICFASLLLLSMGLLLSLLLLLLLLCLMLLRRTHTAFTYASQTFQRPRIYCLTTGS
jgi:hypothetical protein